MRSVLEDLGEEVTGIIAPVSLCMALTVALVRILNPDGASDSNAVFLASAYYTEQDGDSAGQKLSGALINSLIFIGVVAVMTFILVLLFKYGYVRAIYAYMGFAGFSIFFVLAGIILIELLQTWHVHLDFISFVYVLWNFAVVGSLTLFFLPAPLLMKQCYLILTGVVTAYVFTWIPEWTTWVLLLMMALYDVAAVLLPGGPLKMLVELAQEREETIPALVYEARPTRRGDPAQQSMQTMPATGQGTAPSAGATFSAATASYEDLVIHATASLQRNPVASEGSVGGGSSVEHEPTPDTPLISPGPMVQLGSPAAFEVSTRQQTPADHQAAAIGQAERDPATSQLDVPGVLRARGQRLEASGSHQEADDGADGAFSLPDSIKLGLGDFIFYSTLVGRAAMYDYLTVFSCYLAIIAGLGCTLLWLAMAQKALPALPVSIALAVSFYFISRFVLEPVILPMTLELVYF